MCTIERNYPRDLGAESRAPGRRTPFLSWKTLFFAPQPRPWPCSDSKGISLCCAEGNCEKSTLRQPDRVTCIVGPKGVSWSGQPPTKAFSSQFFAAVAFSTSIWHHGGPFGLQSSRLDSPGVLATALGQSTAHTPPEAHAAEMPQQRLPTGSENYTVVSDTQKPYKKETAFLKGKTQLH